MKILIFLSMLGITLFGRGIECEDERVKPLLEKENIKYDDITEIKMVEQTNWNTKCELEINKKFYDMTIHKEDYGISIYLKRQ